MERIICLAIGYLFGMFQTSYIIGKIHHMDIRQYGSGNAGTTNVMRTLGKKAGIATYLLDAFKAVIADILIHFLIVPHTAIPEMLLLMNLIDVPLNPKDSLILFSIYLV